MKSSISISLPKSKLAKRAVGAMPNFHYGANSQFGSNPLEVSANSVGLLNKVLDIYNNSLPCELKDF